MRSLGPGEGFGGRNPVNRALPILGLVLGCTASPVEPVVHVVTDTVYVTRTDTLYRAVVVDHGDGVAVGLAKHEISPADTSRVSCTYSTLYLVNGVLTYASYRCWIKGQPW